MTLSADEQFYYDHAGWSYNPETETEEQGRERCARKLAHAETERRTRGWWVEWTRDDQPFADDVHEPDECGYVAMLYHVAPFTGNREVLAAIGAVDAEDGDPYRRVIMAELAQELLSE